MTSDELYPSKFLKAGDLEHPFVGAIDKVVKENVGRTKEPKPVLYLHGLTKAMILNKTNFTKIVNITGERDSDAWPGKVIEVFATTCDFAGEEVDCLRVRAPRKAGKAQKPAPPPEEWDSAAPPLDAEAM
jgi:hypothetical protein